jgi:hypothetical protein
MNLLNCAFGVSTGKFLSFIVHEKGIEIDPKKMEAIQSVKVPTCKKGFTKVLRQSKLNEEVHLQLVREGKCYYSFTLVEK